MTPAQPIFGLRQSNERSNLFGIQGIPNSGKTTAALSFPSPIVLDFDKKLPVGIQSIAFWDDSFVDSIGCTRLTPLLANRRDAITKWLVDNVAKLPPDATLIVDSWTRVQDAFDQAAFHAPRQPQYMTKGGKDSPPEVDKFKIFQHKIDWSTYVMTLLQAAPCRVVLTFHEQIERDKDGDPTGKFRPLQGGQFADRIAGYCGMLVRQDCIRDNGGQSRYVWQVASDRKFNAVVSPMYQFPTECVNIDVTAGAWQKLETFRKKG